MVWISSATRPNTGLAMYLTQATRYDIMYDTSHRVRAIPKPFKAHMTAS